MGSILEALAARRRAYRFRRSRNPNLHAQARAKPRQTLVPRFPAPARLSQASRSESSRRDLAFSGRERRILRHAPRHHAARPRLQLSSERRDFKDGADSEFATARYASAHHQEIAYALQS